MYRFILTSILAISSISFAGLNTSDSSFIKELKKEIDKKIRVFNSSPQDISDIEWVKYALEHMVNIDQIARKSIDKVYSLNISDQEKEFLLSEVGNIIEKIDDKNLILLKKVLKMHTWPIISKFGVNTDRDAWLLVQHADKDHEFQVDTLKVLENLLEANETSKINYAYLYDRVAVSFYYPEFRRPQLYGTQGQCIEKNKWEPFEIFDIKNLDVRRKNFGLDLFKKYQKIMNGFCK